MSSRVWLVLTAVLLTLIVVLRTSSPPYEAIPESDAPITGTATTAVAESPPPAVAKAGTANTRSSRPRTPSNSADLDRERFHQYLSGELQPNKLTFPQLQRHIDANQQSPESFLAAFQASGDLYWLTNAAVLHPNDPGVQFAMIVHGIDESNRQLWLDRFKASDPNNSLANYLSAREHFKAGRPEQALEDLVAGASKPVFNDFTHYDIQSAEEMYRTAGESPIESTILANIQERLPHLQELRDLSRDLVKLQGAAAKRNDAQTYNELAAIGVQVGEGLGHSQGVRYLLNDLMGIAIQKQMLQTLQPDANYPFLQTTPQQAITDLDAHIQRIKTASRSGGDLANATENEIITYFDRTKVHGELNALEWLAKKQAPHP